jgi:spore germination cell wall hydrolase CwlJ-like protein
METYILIILALMTIILLLCGSPAHAYESIKDVPVWIQTVALEARSEGEEGMSAVARVIQNRAYERKRSLSDIVFAANQFSCWDSNRVSTQKSMPTMQDYSRALEAWVNAELSYHNKPWGMANIYMRKELMPAWLDKGLKKGTVVFLCTVKNHNFYREHQQ